MSLKRGPDGTLQTRIFRLLRTFGCFDAELISQHIGTTRGSCSTACRTLVRRGFIEPKRIRRNGAGPTYFIVYRARRTKLEPVDLRGMMPGSRNGGYANVLAMMRAKCGPGWRPRVRGATALEEAWPVQLRRDER